MYRVRASRTRRWLIGAIVLVVLVGTAGVAAWRVSRARCFTLVGAVTCRVRTTEPLVALTFDDGPTAEGLDAILPVLAAHHAKATFFLIGREVEQHPELARRLVESGQEVGNHTYSHARNLAHPQGFYEDEVGRTEVLLRSVGARSGLFRPPYGKKLIGLPLAVRRHGLRMITWDVEDPITSDPGRFASDMVSQARPGSIILVHAMYSSGVTARSALPAILDGLERRGLRVVTVGTLMARSQPGSATAPS